MNHPGQLSTEALYITTPSAISRPPKSIEHRGLVFRVNLGIWPLKSIIPEKEALFWGFKHTLMGFPRE